jgi:DNA repair/transcription protein MET18/MMS19
MEPETFHEITLTNFMEKLPDTVSQDEKKRRTELELIVGQLQDLVDIACSQPCQRELRDGHPIPTASSYWHRNFDAMEKKLLEKLDVVLQENGQLDYANTILAAICGGLQIFDSSLDLARAGFTEPSPLDPTLGPYSYIVKTLFQQVVQQNEHPNGPYIGIKESVDEKFVQIVGHTAMLALRSHLSTVENSMLFEWNAKYPDEPSVIWTLFTPGPHLASLSISQQNLQKGPADKYLANMLSMYLLAGHLHTRGLVVSFLP